MSMENRPKDTAGWLLITAGILSLAILLMCGCSRKTMAATVSRDTLTAATEVTAAHTASGHTVATATVATDSRDRSVTRDTTATDSRRTTVFGLDERWTITGPGGDTVRQVHHTVGAELATESAANSTSVSDRTADSDTYAENRADIADTFAAGTDTETQTAAASATGTVMRPDTGTGDGWRCGLLVATVIAVVAGVVCVMIRKLIKK